ncbi:MAG: hypothetical protein HQ556_11515 [Candidatus Marinimicrobia bacterium]|nr:hypothetical protein [Candidatus Neomarinimicrobiota bacterium]
MKRTHVTLLLLVVVFFLGCESNLTQPRQSEPQLNESLTGFLAKDPVIVAKLDSIIPSGTKYGLPDDTTTYTATGGEQIPAGGWVENDKDLSYEIHIYSEMKVTFGNFDSVTIDYPTNLDYLDNSDTWVSLTTSKKVGAKAVRTGSFGSAFLTRSGYGEYDEENED